MPGPPAPQPTPGAAPAAPTQKKPTVRIGLPQKPTAGQTISVDLPGVSAAPAPVPGTAPAPAPVPGTAPALVPGTAPGAVPAPAPDQGVPTSNVAPVPGAAAPLPGAAPAQILDANLGGEETTPPGSVPGAPEPQPPPGAIPGAAPAPVAGGGTPDKVEMILAVVAFLITIGCVVVLAIMKV